MARSITFLLHILLRFQSSVTVSQSYTWLIIQSIMRGLNTLRWTVTLFEMLFRMALFLLHMSAHLSSSLTFSRNLLARSTLIPYCASWAFVISILQLEGGCWSITSGVTREYCYLQCNTRVTPGNIVTSSLLVWEYCN